MYRTSAAIVCLIFVSCINCAIRPSDDNCFDLVALSAIFRYFDDQHSMTVADVSEYHAINSIICTGGKYFRPVDVFNDLDKINFGSKVDSSSVSSYPTTHGYYFACKVKDMTDNVYEKLLNYNPRTKFMFELIDADLEEAKEILKMGFDKYNMVNAAAIVFLPVIVGEEKVKFEVTICLYNPFADNSQKGSPEVRCWNFTRENFEKTSIEMENFQKQRIENLQRFPLKISIFEYATKCVAVYDKNGKISHYTYPDGELIATLAEKMNFTPVYKEILDGPKYGYRSPDGVFLGNLGDLEYGKADLIANPMLIINHNSTKSAFLQPVGMLRLFFVVKKRFLYKKILVKVLSQLDNICLSVASVLFFLLPLIYLLINEIERRVHGRNGKPDLVKTLLYVVALQNCVSMKHSTMMASRIAVAVILFYTLISTSILQGNLVEELNSDRNIGKITKIDQIIERNFVIGMEPGLKLVFQKESDDKVSKALNKMTRNLKDFSYQSEDALERLKFDSEFSYLWGAETTGSYLNNFYDNETGENYFDVVPESAFEFYIAMMAPKSSPFIDRLNQLINSYVESGLYQYNTKKASDDNQKIWINRIKNDLIPRTKVKSLKMNEMMDLVTVYVALNICCCLVFILEVISKIIKTRWTPK